MTTLSQYFTNGKMVGITLHADSFKKMFWGSWSWGGREGKLKLTVGLELGGGGRGATQGSTTRVSLFSLAKLSLPSNRSFPALCYLKRLNIIMNVASKYNTAISCKYYFP